MSSQPWTPRSLSPPLDTETALRTAEDATGQAHRLERFLAASERRALRRAEFATRHTADALDIVQDAMLQLARRYAQRPEAEWPLLFSRILTNGIRDWHRRRKLRHALFFWQSIEDDDATPLIENIADPGAGDVGESLDRERQLRQLQAALWRLPQRQREAFELRVREGLNVEATAQAMGCSQGSVKTHLSRALHRLRDELGDWQP